MLESAWRSCNKHNTNTAQRSNRAHRTQRTSVALDDAAAVHLGRFHNVHSAVAALLAGRERTRERERRERERERESERESAHHEAQKGERTIKRPASLLHPQRRHEACMHHPHPPAFQRSCERRPRRDRTGQDERTLWPPIPDQSTAVLMIRRVALGGPPIVNRLSSVASEKAHHHATM